MSQFDVYVNPVPSSRRLYPLVVTLQSELLSERTSQVVAPLAPRRGLSDPHSRLFPVVSIDEEQYIVLVTGLVTLPVRELQKRVANLARHRDSLLGAVDLLFYGV